MLADVAIRGQINFVPVVLGLLIGALYTVATACELWHIQEERLRTPNIAIILFLLHAIVWLLQAVAAVAALKIFLSGNVVLIQIISLAVEMVNFARFNNYRLQDGDLAF